MCYFKIDPVPFENKVTSLKSRLLVAEEDLKRTQSLIQKGVGSRRDRDLAQGQVDDLKAQLSTAEYDLKRTVVRAPTDGFVTQIALRKGAIAVQMPLRPSFGLCTQRKQLFNWLVSPK